MPHTLYIEMPQDEDEAWLPRVDVLSFARFQRALSHLPIVPIKAQAPDIWMANPRWLNLFWRVHETISDLIKVLLVRSLFVDFFAQIMWLEFHVMSEWDQLDEGVRSAFHAFQQAASTLHYAKTVVVYQQFPPVPSIMGPI